MLKLMALGVFAASLLASVASAADPIAEFHLGPHTSVVSKATLKAGQAYPMEIIGTRRAEYTSGSEEHTLLADAFFCYDASKPRLADCQINEENGTKVWPLVSITARTSETTTSHPLQEYITEGAPMPINAAWHHPPYASNHSYGFNFTPKLTGKLLLATSEVCPGKCTGDGFDVKVFNPGESSDPCAHASSAKAHAAAVNEVRVVAVQQSVEVHRAGAPEDAWSPACKDTVLQQGDEISCDPDGAVTLQFADNSTVVIKDTTQLKIASFFTEGGVVRTEILLKMGQIAAKVNRSEATKSDFRIKSPTGVASVRGTDFTVFYDPAAKAMLTTVREGVVDVTPANTALKPVALNPGQEVEVTAKAISKVSATGRAGARAGNNRLSALEKVLKVIARVNGPCGVHTPRSNAFSVKPAKAGWAVSVKLLGKRKGTSAWNVKGKKVKPTNGLAKKLAKRCN